MTQVPTLTTVRKLRDISAVLCESVAKGDADLAIEMLRDAEQCVATALGDYNLAPKTLEPVDMFRSLELARDALHRGKAYGEAASMFRDVANMWSTLLGWPVKPTDVARCLVVVKLVRLSECPGHVDSWVDAAGYAAVGAEVATTEVPDVGT